ncbi:FliM/FliN family flagellar motor switch protein [Lentisphaerota bacterium WC36G]|nr:FliM/FliN family flagellar motor switch protein [Lentisphaerae bacterium WC36]
MSNILDQDEINSLLGAMDDNDIDKSANEANEKLDQQNDEENKEPAVDDSTEKSIENGEKLDNIIDSIEDSRSAPAANISNDIESNKNFDNYFDSSFQNFNQNVKEYNFKHPNVITKEQLNKFQVLHDVLSRDLCGDLAVYMKAGVEVNLIAGEQKQYCDFIESIDENAFNMVFSSDPFPGLAVVNFNLPLINGVLDLLLGGQGDVEKNTNIPTDIEISILTPFLEKIIKQLDKSFNSLTTVKVNNERYCTDKNTIQLAPSDGYVVVISYEVKIGFACGVIKICYPLPMVQQISEFLENEESHVDSYYGKKSAEYSKEDIIKSLFDVPLPLEVTLGETMVNAADLLDLEIGDIITLNHSINSPLKVTVSGNELFSAQPGKIQENIVVKLLERIETNNTK